jgi:hypothetical protein
VQVSPFAKLAKAILFRSAKDMKPGSPERWLQSDACRETCEMAGVNYDSYLEACRFLLKEPNAVRRNLYLQTMKKNMAI